MHTRGSQQTVPHTPTPPDNGQKMGTTDYEWHPHLPNIEANAAEVRLWAGLALSRG